MRNRIVQVGDRENEANINIYNLTRRGYEVRSAYYARTFSPLILGTLGVAERLSCGAGRSKGDAEFVRGRQMMTAPAFVIMSHAPIAYAAGLMLQHKVDSRSRFLGLSVQ